MKIAMISSGLGSGILLVAGWWLLGSLPQDPAYHQFADQREFWSVPNAHNVLSNLGFCLVGLFGIYQVRNTPLTQRHASRLYLTFFLALLLTGIGSAHYHLEPSNQSLVWDRMPMALAFMSFLCIVISEFINPALGRRLFPWLLTGGVGSVIYWYAFDDLRLYALVQFGSLLAVTLILLFKQGAGRMLMLLAIACYILAKVFEATDQMVFEWSSGWVGGHALKHLAAAVGALLVLLRLPDSGIHEKSAHS